MGALLAVFSSVTFAVALFLAKVLTHKTKNLLVIGGVYQLVAAICFIPLLFLEPFKFDSNPQSLFWFAVSAVMYTVFNIANFEMNRYLDISISSLLGQIKIIIMFIGSLIIFSEPLVIGKIIGIILILGGNILLAFRDKSHPGKTLFTAKGLLWCAATIVSLSVSGFIDSILISKYSVNFYGMTLYLIPGIAITIMALARTGLKETLQTVRENKWGIIALGVVSPFGYIAILQAYQIAEKSIVFPLANLTSVILVLMGVFLLNEKQLLRRKLIVAAMVFVGAIFLGLS
jgi:drug/metabolite transporter (DMT)-like permease